MHKERKMDRAGDWVEGNNKCLEIAVEKPIR
jgi:hypothetical protein